jgi:hypothetical protein
VTDPKNQESMAWCLFVCFALVLARCAPVKVPAARTELPAYADGMEYIVPMKLGRISRAQAAATGVTHYFRIDTKSVCYSFQVPGTWEAGLESAMLRRLDGKALVGVLLFSLRQLAARSTEEAIRKAAERSGKLYAKESGGAPWNLTPDERVPGTWQWTMPVQNTINGRPGGAVRIVPRWYLPVGDEWIAQFTIAVPPDVDRDAFVTDVLTSLTTSRESRCYEARLRELGGVR